MLPTPERDWALFLDIDGTLIEHADHPEGITVPERLPGLLADVSAALDGAVALVSGRTIDWMDEKFAPVRLAAAGQHGAEIRLAPDAPAVPIPMPKWRAPLEAALEREIGAWPGVFIEHKPLSLAVHFRAVPDQGRAVMERVIELGRALDARAEFLKGIYVIEVRAGGHTKGTAVETLMKSALFAGRRPVFIGDDITDEDGFRAAKRADGIAIAVGPRAAAEAQHHLAGPVEVRAWLGAIPLMLERVPT